MATVQYLSIEDVCALLQIETPSHLCGRRFRGVSTLEAAGPDEISYLVKERFLAKAHESRAGLLLAPPGLAFEREGLVVLPHVMVGVIKLLNAFNPDPRPVAHIDPTAVVAQTAVIGREVYIGPQVVIEDHVVIGDNTRIEAGCFIGRDSRLGADCWLSPRVVLMHETQLGARVRLHPGVVLGADGFRLEMIGGRLVQVPQVGRVIIEDDVSIGANTTIDRASLTETRIGARTKIDNMVHIGHNVVVESDCVIVAQVGIGGSTRVGRGTMLGGRAAVKDNIVIGAGSRIGGNSGVQNNLPPRSDVMGFPALPVRDYARFAGFMRRFSVHWKKLKPVLGGRLDDDDSTPTGGDNQG